MALDDAAVAEIQRLYADTKVTVAQIGEQFGVSPSAICKLARQRGWPTRGELMGRSPRRGQPSTPKARAMLAHRLCDAITKKLGPIVGFDITGDLVREAGEQIVQTVQAFGGLLGTILTIYGRLRASQPLEQRSMMIKL
jgi:hypothetical protein